MWRLGFADPLVELRPLLFRIYGDRLQSSLELYLGPCVTFADRPRFILGRGQPLLLLEPVTRSEQTFGYFRTGAVYQLSRSTAQVVFAG